MTAESALDDDRLWIHMTVELIVFRHVNAVKLILRRVELQSLLFFASACSLLVSLNEPLLQVGRILEALIVNVQRLVNA